MRTVLLASLRHHRRRYVASALAVIIGVGFIVTVNGLAGSLRAGMTSDVGRTFAGADWIVRTYEPEDAAATVAAAEKSGGAAAAMWSGWSQARFDGRSLEELSVSTVAEDERLVWQELVDGRLPTRPGEAVLGERGQAARGLEVGDVLTFGAGNETSSVTLVGVVADTTYGRADVHLLPQDAELVPGLWLQHVRVAGDRPTPPGESEVLSTREYVADLQAEITRGVDVIALLVSIFAAIALGVAVLVITNTFAILFAQRSRDFALLRCVGVTARQLRRSVRVEALVLGIVSSVIGAVIGVLLAFGIALLIGLRVDVMGTASFDTPWVVGAVAVGLVVTLVAAWLPTRAVTRISPLSALRPQGGIDARSRAGVLRAVAGTLVLGAGVALLALVVVLTGGDGPDVTVLVLGMFAGGAAAFTGVMLLGPFLVPAGLRLAGRLVSRRGARGAVTRLATSNSVRNPRRTATTAASLMVGVTLTTAVLTGLASVGSTLDDEMEASYPLDVAVVAAPGASASEVDALLAAVRGTDGVDEAGVQRSATVQAAGTELRVVAVEGTEDVLRATRADVYDEYRAIIPFRIANGVEEAFVAGDGDVLRVGEGKSSVELPFAFGDEYGALTAAVRPDVLDELVANGVAAPAAGVVWVRAQDGADPTQLETDLTKAAATTAVGTVELDGDLANRHFVSSQFTVMTVAVVGLLGVAVVIALIGIGNTLGLSVLERTQENSLLRAMGLTRGQLRRTLAWEGLLLAAVSTVMGVVLGLAFAWVGVQVLVGPMMLDTSLTVPFVQVAAVVLVAVVSGVVASVLPSRRAAQVSPAEGLSLA